MHRYVCIGLVCARNRDEIPIAIMVSATQIDWSHINKYITHFRSYNRVIYKQLFTSWNQCE